MKIGKFEWLGVSDRWLEDCWIKGNAFPTPRDCYEHSWRRGSYGLDFLAAAELAFKNGRRPTELEIEVKIVMLRLEGLT